MDFLLACPKCRGALLAHESLRDTRARCPHCLADIEVPHGQAITESVVNRFLDVPGLGQVSAPLRRLRPIPPAAHTSVSSHPPLQRQARILPHRFLERAAGAGK